MSWHGHGSCFSCTVCVNPLSLPELHFLTTGWSFWLDRFAWWTFPNHWVWYASTSTRHTNILSSLRMVHCPNNLWSAVVLWWFFSLGGFIKINFRAWHMRHTYILIDGLCSWISIGWLLDTVVGLGRYKVGVADRPNHHLHHLQTMICMSCDKRLTNRALAQETECEKVPFGNAQNKGATAILMELSGHCIWTFSVS